MWMTMSMMIVFSDVLYNWYRLIYRNELYCDDFYVYSQLMMMILLLMDSVSYDIVVLVLLIGHGM